MKTYKVYLFHPDNPAHLEKLLEDLLGLELTGDYYIFKRAPDGVFVEGRWTTL